MDQKREEKGRNKEGLADVRKLQTRREGNKSKIKEDERKKEGWQQMN
jgi:hypothetical protein